MATISSLGIGSGLDLSSIVSGLVDAERAPVESRLAFKEETITTKLSAFGALKSSLSLFQSSMSSLKYASTFDSKSVSSSDDSVFSASVLSNADVGSYAVEVSALAKNQSLASSSVFSDINDTIGSGTMSIAFGTTTITDTPSYSFVQDTSKATQTITVSAANNNTTLSGLKDYINENDYGVKAAIVNDGTGYRLTLTSENSGASNSMEITVTGDSVGTDTDNNGLSQLAFNASTYQTSMLQTVAAQDATLTINGLDITRENNTVTGAIEGLTLNLQKADVGNTVTVNIAEDTNGIKSSIQEFVDGYNGLTGTINTLTSYNPETTAAGLLIGDFTVRSISNQLRNLVAGTVPQLTGSIKSLIDIGIKTNSDGTLELDTAKLDSALSNYPSEVGALFTLQGRPTDSDLSYSAATDDTLAGNYAVNVSAMATQGMYNATALNTLIIDATNDEFTISVNGVSSSSIMLTHGTYADADALAEHIQAQINDDDNLKSSEASVTVTYDGTGELDITSTKYGSASTIEFTAVDTATNDLGLALGSGVDGVDVAGTINNQIASGNGQLLSSEYGDSQGLALLVSGGSSGNRGTVSFSRGIATSIDNLLSSFLDSEGFIGSREDGLNDQLEEISEERLKLDLRITNLEARLINQFSALDSLISQFNSTSSFLTDALANLPKPNSINNNN